jgi:hypothetical protein
MTDVSSNFYITDVSSNSHNTTELEYEILIEFLQGDANLLTLINILIKHFNNSEGESIIEKVNNMDFKKENGQVDINCILPNILLLTCLLNETKKNNNKEHEKFVVSMLKDSWTVFIDTYMQ